MANALKIVFHGDNAANFRSGLEGLLQHPHQIVSVAQALDRAEDIAHFQTADVIVGIALNDSMPRPQSMRLFQAPSAGTDGI